MTITTTNDLGTAVRNARRAQHLRQEDLALVTGTGLRFIGELERGKPTLQVSKVLRVLAALGLKVDLDESAARGDA